MFFHEKLFAPVIQVAHFVTDVVQAPLLDVWQGRRTDFPDHVIRFWIDPFIGLQCLIDPIAGGVTVVKRFVRGLAQSANDSQSADQADNPKSQTSLTDSNHVNASRVAL